MEGEGNYCLFRCLYTITIREQNSACFSVKLMVRTVVIVPERGTWKLILLRLPTGVASKNSLIVVKVF